MLSVKITNALCNLQCTYCYEHVYREKANQRPFALDAILRQIENEGESPYLHGGEPLLAPISAVEKILSLCYEKEGFSSMQTNATLITEEHIKLFKRYKTHVGISIDGPGEMSKFRIPVDGNAKVGSDVWETIKRLRDEDIHVGIICVLTKANALPEQREEFKKWIRELRALGITGRMNPAEIDYPRIKKIALTPSELAEFYTDMAQFILTDIGGDWLPFRDIVDSLLGLDQGTCVFSECDYYNSVAEKVVLSDGTTAMCMKSSKTGHIYPRFQNAGSEGFAKIRYQMLPLVEQEHGGCKDCKYWRNCTGGCPAEGLNGDWRNRSRYCESYYALYEETARLLKTMLPNIQLTTDRAECNFPISNSIAGMSPEAVELLSNTSCGRPSTWRAESKSYIRGRDASNPGTRPRHIDRPHADHGDRTIGERSGGVE